MHTFLNELNKLAYVLAPVFYKLVWMSLTAVLVGGILLLVRRLWDKKIPPAWKSLLWALVLLCLLVPYRIQSPFSLAGELEPLEQISYREEYDALQQQAHLAMQGSDAAETAVPEELARKEKTLYVKSALFDVALPVGWGVGMMAAFVWLISNHLSFAKQLQKGEKDPFPNLAKDCRKTLGIQREISVQIQPGLGTPALTGIFRPRILLPEYADQMDESSLRYVLLHELGHYKRKDLWVNELLLILQCVYWFNPLLWFLFRAMREDMELLNDSYVLKKINETDDRPYARSLVEVLGRAQKMPLTPRLVTMTDGSQNVKRRISMMKERNFFKKHRAVIGAACAALALLLAALFLTTGESAEEKAVRQLVESIQQENGIIQFIVPEQYKKTENWNIQIFGRQEFPDGMSMSAHPLEEISAGNAWEPGHAYEIDTNEMHYTELGMYVSLPGEVEKDVDLLLYLNESPAGEVRELTQEEIEKVNQAFDSLVSDGLFNQKQKANPLCLFLSSDYSKPAEMNAKAFVWYLEGENRQVSQEEFKELQKMESFPYKKAESPEDMVTPLRRIPRKTVDKLLEKYMGITADELDLTACPYLGEPYNSFYSWSSDMGVPVFECTGGEVSDDRVTLLGKNGEEMVLKKQKDQYCFYAHKKA